MPTCVTRICMSNFHLQNVSQNPQRPQWQQSFLSCRSDEPSTWPRPAMKATPWKSTLTTRLVSRSESSNMTCPNPVVAPRPLRSTLPDPQGHSWSRSTGQAIAALPLPSAQQSWWRCSWVGLYYAKHWNGSKLSDFGGNSPENRFTY